MLIVDLTAICDREVLPLRTGTFNFRTAMSRVIQERGLCVLTVKNRVPTLWRSRRLRLRSDVMGVDTARVPSRFARALAFLAPTLALRADRQKRENLREPWLIVPAAEAREGTADRSGISVCVPELYHRIYRQRRRLHVSVGCESEYCVATRIR